MPEPSSCPPIDLAIRKLSRARRLLDLLITSSESFDYPAAKLALNELRKMIHELARAEARLRAERPLEANCISLESAAALEPKEPSSGMRSKDG